MKSITVFFFVALLTLLLWSEPKAQDFDPFQIPEFVKVELADAAAFQQRFRNIQWTGQGFQGATAIDQIPAMELRARFQAAFGNPTKRIQDLAASPNFRMAEAIQYEYWFIINDEIPLIVLDVDGPFATGLVYAGPVTYIDYMPEIKRTLSSLLMSVQALEPYMDYFYSPERNQWYEIKYDNGDFSTKEISRPSSIRNFRTN